MRSSPLLLLALALACAGCTTGPSAEQFRPAVSPRGVSVQLQLRARRADVSGELLEVRTTGFVVLAASKVVLVPFGEVRGAKFAQMRLGYVGGTPGASTFEAMRRVSRFPGGLPPEQMARLLASLGQTELRAFGQ
jgi:hypothetical protein